MRYLILLLLALSSCYKYSHTLDYTLSAQSSDYSLMILVDARGLDYSCASNFLLSLSSQPRTTYGRFGHAWIYLKGIEEGIPVYIEGGHSGERGVMCPQYFDGVMDLVDAKDPNPIRYLWEIQPDGFFEEGSGHHKPNAGIKIEITEEQYLAIKDFICAAKYDDYAITGNQCSSFVAQIAAIAGVNLVYEVTLEIPQNICFGGRKMVLWTDPCYSQITFGSPDKILESFAPLIQSHQAQPVNL